MRTMLLTWIVYVSGSKYNKYGKRSSSDVLRIVKPYWAPTSDVSPTAPSLIIFPTCRSGVQQGYSPRRRCISSSRHRADPSRWRSREVAEVRDAVDGVGEVGGVTEGKVRLWQAREHGARARLNDDLVVVTPHYNVCLLEGRAAQSWAGARCLSSGIARSCAGKWPGRAQAWENSSNRTPPRATRGGCRRVAGPSPTSRQGSSRQPARIAH
ncbi:hypothetical protein B0H13DRAFT_294262 [Mycena leptocephala]|nr:hypothetical protein B0H13DRAFT_294262 [Mycena leptocephala]